MTSESHPESGTTNYTHDNVGNVVSTEIVGRSITIAYQYDNNYRLTDILAPGSLHDVALAYDDRDNRTGLSNGTVATTILYDAANRPYQRTDVIDGESFVTGYGYDTRDNLTSVTYPSGRVVTYSYDYADRITGVTCPSATWASSFSSHASGAVAGYTSGNGQTTTISCDARQRPDVLASGPLSLDYTYDAVGNVTAIDDVRSGFDQGFGYDVVDRLTSVTGFGAETYGYDARGNRTAKGGATYTYHGSSDHLTSDGVQSYTYDGAGNAATIGSQAFTYTPFHLVETATVGSAVTTYRYDGDNQRRLRTRADGTQEYFVPGPGLVPLAEYRKAPGGARVLVREYIYAGDRLIASVGLEPVALPSVAWTDDPIVPGVTAVKAVHLTELRDAVNAARVAHGLSAAPWTDATVTAGVTVIQAVHISELRTALNAVYTAAGVTPPTYTDPVLVAGVTDIRAVHLTELRAARANVPAEIGATRYYHLDALGSVRAVTDAAGATVRRHDYAAFGEAPTPGLGADARRFTGKDRDTETGLDYFAARYYHASSGRFTTPDPGHIGGDIFDPQSWNAYAYARNNPLRFVDPTGTDYEISIYSGATWTLEDQDFRRLQENPGEGFFITPSGVYQRRDGRMTLIGDVRYIDRFSQALGDIAQRSDRGIRGGISAMARNAVWAFGGGLLRWGLEAGQGALFQAQLGRALRVGAVTTHAAQRMALRAITPGEALAAIRTARQLGRVEARLGKYGTTNLHFIGANGVTVVVETQGRNAGRIITTYRTGGGQ